MPSAPTLDSALRRVQVWRDWWELASILVYRDEDWIVRCARAWARSRGQLPLAVDFLLDVEP